jgi:hypothetical protein
MAGNQASMNTYNHIDRAIQHIKCIFPLIKEARIKSVLRKNKGSIWGTMDELSADKRIMSSIDVSTLTTDSTVGASASTHKSLQVKLVSSDSLSLVNTDDVCVFSKFDQM